MIAVYGFRGEAPLPVYSFVGERRLNIYVPFRMISVDRRGAVQTKRITLREYSERRREWIQGSRPGSSLGFPLGLDWDYTGMDWDYSGK
jgi:hypothetical protein